MTETRAVANLPNLNIEILHREAPQEGAEYLSIILRGTPDLGAALRLLDPFGLLLAGPAAASFDPWRAWLRLADPFGLWHRPAPAALPPRGGDRPA
jgi:hypothetical protein